MQQFFVEDEQISESQARIEGADAHHIRDVLRMRPGERLFLCTTGGVRLYAHLLGFSDHAVLAQIDALAPSTELPMAVTLFQGLPKADKMESILQKSVELGVTSVVPVQMSRCVIRWDESKAQRRLMRWQAIAKSAAEQSKRSIIPEVFSPMSFAQAISFAKSLDSTLIAYENERGMRGTKEALRSLLPGQSVGIFVGPEGGFSEEELLLLPQEAARISLGKRILRTETAGPAALAMLAYEWENE